MSSCHHRAVQHSARPRVRQFHQLPSGSTGKARDAEHCMGKEKRWHSDGGRELGTWWGAPERGFGEKAQKSRRGKQQTANVCVVFPSSPPAVWKIPSCSATSEALNRNVGTCPSALRTEGFRCKCRAVTVHSPNANYTEMYCINLCSTFPLMGEKLYLQILFIRGLEAVT